jgi:YHS domain-containing protein
MRLLILMGLLYLCYKFLKSWVLKGTSPRKPAFEKKRGEIDDVMVKDPYCEIYFAKKDGVHLNINGKDIYFCSEECKDKFLHNQIDRRNTG